MIIEITNKIVNTDKDDDEIDPLIGSGEILKAAEEAEAAGGKHRSIYLLAGRKEAVASTPVPVAHREQRECKAGDAHNPVAPRVTHHKHHNRQSHIEQCRGGTEQRQCAVAEHREREVVEAVGTHNAAYQILRTQQHKQHSATRE